MRAPLPPEAVLGALDPAAPLLLEPGRESSCGELLARAARVARALAGSDACINLCERREHFLVAWLGALLRGCPTLMPPSRAPQVVASVQALHACARTLEDADVLALAPPAGAPLAPPADAALRVPGARLLMIGYTSGSTGQPAAHAKTWGSVLASTRANEDAILHALADVMGDAMGNAAADTVGEAMRATLAAGQARPTIVGTVPSQHMYGMELTVLLPLLAGWRLHGARPLLPQDVAVALAQAPAPRVLVSTPAHLRAIVASGVALPEVAVTISATAPLDAALAGEVERMTRGTLLEMFGSTETCIFAARRTAREQDWRAYDGLRFTPGESGTLVEAPWFARPQQLQDILDVPAPGRFRLLGRNSDLVDVAGKRASLAELTARMLAIPGVRDAAVFQPDAPAGDTSLVRRLAALVVAPGLDAARIRAALGQGMDPVFMPRPLLLVEALPRTEAGKLPRAALLAALAAHAAARNAG